MAISISSNVPAGAASAGTQTAAASSPAPLSDTARKLLSDNTQAGTLNPGMLAQSLAAQPRSQRDQLLQEVRPHLSERDQQSLDTELKNIFLDHIKHAAQKLQQLKDTLCRILQTAKDNTQAAPSERTLVAAEDSVQAGGVRDAYDMQLYQETNGSYTLELNMKVGMNFVAGPQGQQWTAAAQEQFKQDFVKVIEGTWSGHAFTSDTGQQIKLDVNLDIVSATDKTANWNADIVKINEDKGEFHQSYVIPSQNTGVFDSGDVKPVAKGATDPQSAAAHEFGHMIGLPDEYNGRAGRAAQQDTNSIMHSGMGVRDRHLDIVESWVNANN